MAQVANSKYGAQGDWQQPFPHIPAQLPAKAKRWHGVGHRDGAVEICAAKPYAVARQYFHPPTNISEDGEIRRAAADINNQSSRMSRPHAATGNGCGFRFRQKRDVLKPSGMVASAQVCLRLGILSRIVGMEPYRPARLGRA